MNNAVSIENTKKRLEDIEAEISELKRKQSDLKELWLTEKASIRLIRDYKEKIEAAKKQAEDFEREGNLAKVAELRYGTILSYENALKQESEKLATIQDSGKMLKEKVTAEDIAEVLSKSTGIPVKKMLETERTKLLSIEDKLKERVIGQDEATVALANSIRRSRAGLQDPNRPIGSFIFLGSTGVGKTEMAKALAENLFNDENSIVRIDMSEYMEKFSVSKLIGAPPGYVGYDEGGQLTEAIRRKPYSVVLLDEIEKADRDVFNVLLQVLEDGRLTDGKGRTVNFKNTIIIMTSNLGSEIINKNIDLINSSNREQVLRDTKTEMFELLKRSLRPEFLNRIDEIIIFNPLTKNELAAIVKLQLSLLAKRAVEEEIVLHFSDNLIDFISQIGFDPHFGARPLKREIQRYIADPLAVKILSGEVLPNTEITLNIDSDGKLIVEGNN